MSSLSVYTVFDRTDDGSKLNRKCESANPFQVTPSFGTNATSVFRPSPVVHSADESKFDAEYSFTSSDYETSKNCENIRFIYLDLDSQLTSNSIDSLRAINNDVHTYTDPSTCLDFVRSLQERIFVISSSADKQLIEEFHNLNSVEAMFILNSEAQIDSRFPKLYGVYTHFEELLMALKDTLEWFEQTQMDLFVFEHDRIFLWSQLWKEEFLKSQKSKGSSNKEKFLQVAENYYRQNIKLNQSINEFNQSYNAKDALYWCFSSPFPSSFLRHALRSHDTEHLDACRFLLTDLSCIIQEQSDKKSSCELYRGMKMTNEFLDKLENHSGELICAKGFLICSQSRRIALEAANSPDHRPDLVPVLFKITYDRSVPLAELSNKGTASSMVFDIYTAFRVKYVKRGQVSIVKIEPADEDGRKLARDYRTKHRSESVQNLLDQLLFPSKYPTTLSPYQPAPSTECLLPNLSPNEVSVSIIAEDYGEEENEGEEDEEVQAQRLIQRGEIDKAITIYERLETDPRILNIIGLLYAEKKGDYDTAINYYKRALKLQEKKGEDVSNTLSQLGNVHQNRREYDLALACHSRAFHKRKKMHHIDQTLVANSLTGMANAYWGQRKLKEALKHAEQALTLNESIGSENEMHIAANLATLANIHQNSGNTDKALEVAMRAITLLERCVPSDSPALATLINNIGTMQVAKGLFADARHSFSKALEICEKSLPEGHPKRVSMANNIQRITEIEKMNANESDA